MDIIPRIDVVTVSHNHYDHLDINSLKKIAKKHPDAIFLVPAGDEKLLSRKKLIMFIVLVGGNHLILLVLNLHSPLYNIGLKDRYLIEIKVYGVAGS